MLCLRRFADALTLRSRHYVSEQKFFKLIVVFMFFARTATDLLDFQRRHLSDHKPVVPSSHCLFVCWGVFFIAAPYFVLPLNRPRNLTLLLQNKASRIRTPGNRLETSQASLRYTLSIIGIRFRGLHPVYSALEYTFTVAGLQRFLPQILISEASAAALRLQERRRQTVVMSYLPE